MKTLPAVRNYPARPYFRMRLTQTVALGLGLQGRGVSYFPTSLCWRFFRLKESLEDFSALPGGSRIGEFLTRKQARHGMESAVL